MRLIKKVILDVNQTNNNIVSGIVQNINDDGTVDVRIPPDTTTLTGISNQTPFILQVGDAVKLLKEKNRMSNMWIIAKCGMANGANNFKDIPGYIEDKNQILTHDQNGVLLWVNNEN